MTRLGLYLDFHVPLELAHLIQGLLKGGHYWHPSRAPESEPGVTAERKWLSQPRVSRDPTVEVLTINFKLPLPISTVEMEILRESCRVEIWYLDRLGNWLHMRNTQRVPLVVRMSASGRDSWYPYSTQVYPVVAKAVQIRIRRTPDPAVGTNPYSVGVRNTLIRRNVYDRDQAVQDFDVEQDGLGNVVSRFVRDWGPENAIDGKPSSYWRSPPMPSPDAVVAMYLDVRTDENHPQRIDSLYIDPVHSGPRMNIYYSDQEEAASGLRLSPIRAIPSWEQNTHWRRGRGLRDESSSRSIYRFPMTRGPLIQKDSWVGIEWSPDFDSSSGPSLNPVLMSVRPGATDESGDVEAKYITGRFSPTLRFNSGESRFEVEFYDGSSVVSAKSDPVHFPAGDSLRVVCGWTYRGGIETPTITISVADHKGREISLTSVEVPDMPEVVSFDGEIEIRDFRGLLTAMVIKSERMYDPDEGVPEEGWDGPARRFQSGATLYCAPDPVLPDESGLLPSTSLDNAFYAVDWTSQNHGRGGTDKSFFDTKTWTPVWRNYRCQRGMVYLPQPISARYLKLEFFNLVPEHYPVYEAGIETVYQTFPISVTQQSSLSVSASGGMSLGPGGFTASGEVVINGETVNWLSPSSVISAIRSVTNPKRHPVIVEAGPSFITSTIPHSAERPISGDIRVEAAADVVFDRKPIDSWAMAQFQYYESILNQGVSGLLEKGLTPWEELLRGNPSALTTAVQQAFPALQSENWWVFPGQTMSLPAAIMESLTNSSISVGGRITYDDSLRFNTNSVHRYDIKTARRDAALAYFAGVREVIPMATSYLEHADNVRWEFPQYLRDSWTMDSAVVYDNGVIGRDTDDTGILYAEFQTTTGFTRLYADFQDSGLLRSDGMWARDSGDSVAHGVQVIEEDEESGTWGSAFATWGDDKVVWSAPMSMATVEMSDERSYLGRRVVTVERRRNAPAVGLSVRQRTNMIDDALIRLGCTVYREGKTSNSVVLALVRTDDQTPVMTASVPVESDQWFDWKTPFFELGQEDEHDYEIRILFTGDEDDKVYVADLFVEIAGIRYFVRLGDSGEVMQEVTELAYRKSAYAVAQDPVTKCAVTVMIQSPNAWAYGATLTPKYLR